MKETSGNAKVSWQKCKNLYMKSESVVYVLTYRKTNGCSMSKTKTL